jgi:signal transduction histidine kinase
MAEKLLSVGLDVGTTTTQMVLSQLWVNLLSNAIKFTPEGGRIVVRLTQDSEWVKVMVRDNGIGMSPETLQHVFEKFYQGDRSHSVEGNGLGLALVKRIVELCGGNISIESEDKKGTTVYVSLPVKTQSEQNPA